MTRLTLYSGPGCCLCETAKALIEKVALDIPLDVQIQDITSDPLLFERFRHAIPVVALEGQVVMAGKVSELWLRKALRGEKLERASLAALGESAEASFAHHSTARQFEHLHDLCLVRPPQVQGGSALDRHPGELGDRLQQASSTRRRLR